MATPTNTPTPFEFVACQGAGRREVVDGWIETIPANPAQRDCSELRDRAINGQIN